MYSDRNVCQEKLIIHKIITVSLELGTVSETDYCTFLLEYKAADVDSNRRGVDRLIFTNLSLI